jgi:hypothetical protein
MLLFIMQLQALPPDMRWIFYGEFRNIYYEYIPG